MKEAYYFSHDSNARHDPKITAMRGVYGSEGYGWFWMLVEMMRETDGYKLDMQSKYAFNAFALQLQADSKRIEEFVHDCINEFNLFISDGENFWSDSLLRRMKIKEEKSEKARQSAMKRWEKQEENADNMRTHNEGNANGMQGKERKDKSKENKKPSSSSDDTASSLIGFYHDEFLKRFDAKPMIIGGKHGKLLKNLLSNYQYEDIKKYICMYLDDDDSFISGKGYTIEIFVSNIQKYVLQKPVKKIPVYEESATDYVNSIDAEVMRLLNAN